MRGTHTIGAQDLLLSLCSVITLGRAWVNLCGLGFKPNLIGYIIRQISSILYYLSSLNIYNMVWFTHQVVLRISLDSMLRDYSRHVWRALEGIGY